MGSSCIMIWRGIGYQGKMEIKFITRKLDSKKYIEMINEQITCTTQISENKYIVSTISFQRDGESNKTKRIRVLE